MGVADVAGHVEGLEGVEVIEGEVDMEGAAGAAGGRVRGAGEVVGAPLPPPVSHVTPRRCMRIARSGSGRGPPASTSSSNFSRRSATSRW